MLHSRRLQHLRTASIESCTKKKRVQDKRAFVCFSGSQMSTRLGEAADLKSSQQCSLLKHSDCAIVLPAVLSGQNEHRPVLVSMCAILWLNYLVQIGFVKRGLCRCARPPRWLAVPTLSKGHQHSSVYIPTIKGFHLLKHSLAPITSTPKIHSPEV